jgi:hypothetical protein
MSKKNSSPAADLAASSSSRRRRSNSLGDAANTSVRPSTLSLRSSPRGLTPNYSRPGSPSPLAAVPSEADTLRSSPRVVKKGSCPCGKSSAGKDWILVCCNCNQKWHSSCPNQKGTEFLTQAQVDKMLKTWPCPW